MSRRQEGQGHRLDRVTGPSLQNWKQPEGPAAEQMKADAVVEMGWGRLIFGHTFESPEQVADALTAQTRSRRDIALYLRDPHVVLSLAPQQLFLDPSHTYRLWRHDYQPSQRAVTNLVIRRISDRSDAEAVSRIYETRQMAPVDPAFLLEQNTCRTRFCLVAESEADGQILGTVTGVDHVEAFNDPEAGGSFWSLAVDPQAQVPGVGVSLVRHVVEHFFARERAYVDLSVMHDNEQAIGLYEKLGFQRVPVFCVKQKNAINEPLFVGPGAEARLNPYAKIIVDEARRRGIAVELLDAAEGYFALSQGGRRIVCRESLTELTSAIAMSRCDDKRVTRRVLDAAGVRVPAQRPVGDATSNADFLATHETVVVKPARGEQGQGVSVGITEPEELEEAVELAGQAGTRVILEACHEGEDLRVIVIGGEVVAAAVRRPPVLTGTGEHTVRELLEKYNRRRRSATGGESEIPFDDETTRCLEEAGYDWDDTPEAGSKIVARKAANLHTGGTIHDVTESLHRTLADACVTAAEALDIPVVGLDLIVSAADEPEYVMIEANERPGLANHEPQPTAERFIDYLFPQSIVGDQPGAS